MTSQRPSSCFLGIQGRNPKFSQLWGIRSMQDRGLHGMTWTRTLLRHGREGRHENEAMEQMGPGCLGGGWWISSYLCVGWWSLTYVGGGWWRPSYLGGGWWGSSYLGIGGWGTKLSWWWVVGESQLSHWVLLLLFKITWPKIWESLKKL